MPDEVYVFGDSHWRVFFPFLNTGAPGICYEEDGVVFLDTIANELSGATMWGLLNEKSRHGARSRILDTIDAAKGVDNVALVFGEVDARFHYSRYYRADGSLSMPSVIDLVARYKRFIDDDLLASGRVRGSVFVYHGFRYLGGPATPTDAGADLGSEGFPRASRVNFAVEEMLRRIIEIDESDRITAILPRDAVAPHVSSDGVHLDPAGIFRSITFPAIKAVLR